MRKVVHADVLPLGKATEGDRIKGVKCVCCAKSVNSYRAGAGNEACSNCVLTGAYADYLDKIDDKKSVKNQKRWVKRSRKQGAQYRKKKYRMRSK